MDERMNVVDEVSRKIVVKSDQIREPSHHADFLDTVK